MAKQAESLFKEKVRRDLVALGGPIWICKTQQVSIRGTPDFLICMNGHFVALELKKDPKAKVSALQEYNIDEICLAHGFGFIVLPENWAGILKFLETLMEREIKNDSNQL